ncbi:MAG: oligosaccharide flippase family protein [Archangiaceae bacterium]|nr:oligosaccharide flippase family protein [Archangiaceae bacterium]
MSETEAKTQSVGARAASATLNYGLGRILPRIIGFLVIPLYAAVLTPSDYGTLDILAGAGDVLFIFMRLGVPGAVSRFYFEHREGPELRDYLTTIGWFQMTCSMVVGALAIAAWPLFSPAFLTGIPLVPLGLLVVVTASLLGASDIQRRIIQSREQSAYSSKLTIVMSVLQLALTVVFVAILKMGVYGMLVSMLIGATIGYAQATYYLAPDLKGRFRWPLLRDSLTYAAGTLPNQLIAQFAPLGNRALLASTRSMASLGLLSVASRFASPLSILTQSFSSAYLPIYFSLRKEDTEDSRQRIVTLTRLAWSFFLLATLGVLLVAPPVVELILPASYQQSARLVPWVALGSLAEFIYVLVSPEIFYAKKSWMPSIVSGTTAAVSLLTTFLLVDSLGPVGVALANVVALLASSIVGALMTRRLISLPVPWKAMSATAAVGLLFAGASFFTLQLNPLARLAVNGALWVGFLGLLLLRRDPLVDEVLQRLGRRRKAT